jgi:hypothetical protein
MIILASPVQASIPCPNSIGKDSRRRHIEFVDTYQDHLIFLASPALSRLDVINTISGLVQAPALRCSSTGFSCLLTPARALLAKLRLRARSC